MNELDVFISHSSRDKAIADHICYMLETNGFNCWIAPRNIRPGQLYALEIMRGLKSCRIMVLIFSKYSNSSQHVANELDHAFNENIPIIPFLIDNTPINEEFDYYLSRKQQLIAYPRYENKLVELIGAVAKILEEMPPKPPSKWFIKSPFNEGFSLVCNYSDKWGFININDKEVIPCKWLEAKDFSEGMAAVRAQNGKWGYINKTGKVVIPCSWSDADNFSNGQARVSDNSGKSFIINKKGLIVAQG